MDAQKTNRIASQGLKLTVAGFFLAIVYLLPIQTNAQVVWEPVYVPMNITSSFGVATGTFQWPSDIILHNNRVEFGMKELPTNFNFYARPVNPYLTQCYPLSGGTSSFQNGIQTITFTASTSQTSNNLLGAPDCDVSGTYYHIFRDTTASSTKLYILSWYYNAETNIYSSSNVLSSSTSTPTTQIPKNIEILKPTYGTTTSSTSVAYSVKFKTPFSIDFRPTTTRKIVIIDAITLNEDFVSETVIPANSSENLTINGTTTVPIGSKYISAYYLDQNGVLYSEVDTVFFNVATNTYYSLTGLENPKDTTSDFSQIDCALYDVGCQFQKALVFLFIPPSTSLDKWSNLWQTIAEKRPFGYFTVTKNALENLDENASSAFDLGTIPFMDTIFTPFRTLIAGILWSIFAIFFFKNRLSRLDI
jgi:hypothetical protein